MVIQRVTTGLEAFLAEPPRSLAQARLGLLCNQASVDSSLRHARDLVAKKVGRRLTTLFAPQHGIFGEKQDNMIESAHGRDPVLGVPVYSLYADVRRPTAAMFADVDALQEEVFTERNRVLHSRAKSQKSQGHDRDVMYAVSKR